MAYLVENTIELGNTIVLLRQTRGISQEHLALYSDISVAHLREIEHGRANPTFKTFCRIANTLEVPARIFGVILLDDENILDRVHKARKILQKPKRELMGV